MISTLFSSTAPTARVETVRLALSLTTELTVLIGLLPIAMAHNAVHHLFFAFFAGAMLFFAGGGGGGVGYSAIRRFMPAHLQARYDAAPWLMSVALYVYFRLTASSMSTCLSVFFLGVVPITGALLTYNSKEYSWDTKWARENPERAAVKAAAEAIENATWWAAARYNAAAFLGMMTATVALIAAMYFWTIRLQALLRSLS